MFANVTVWWATSVQTNGGCRTVDGAREERERERERERNARMDVGAMATTRGGLLAAEWVSA